MRPAIIRPKMKSGGRAGVCKADGGGSAVVEICGIWRLASVRKGTLLGDARVVYNAVELHHDATQPLPPPHRAPSLLPASPSAPANPHQYISA